MCIDGEQQKPASKALYLTDYFCRIRQSLLLLLCFVINKMISLTIISHLHVHSKYTCTLNVYISLKNN